MWIYTFSFYTHQSIITIIGYISYTVIRERFTIYKRLSTFISITIVAVFTIIFIISRVGIIVVYWFTAIATGVEVLVVATFTVAFVLSVIDIFFIYILTTIIAVNIVTNLTRSTY